MEKVRTSNQVRHSFVRRKLTTYEVCKVMLPYGFNSFGTQHDHIDSFRQIFVKTCEWYLQIVNRLTESQYRQIINLCQSLPGSTAVQILIIISTMLTKSPMAGFISFLLYTLPASIALFTLGMIIGDYVKDQDSMPVQVRLIFLGFKSAGAGIMAVTFVRAIIPHYNNIFKLLIVLITSFCYYNFRSTNCIQVCLILGAIISLYVKIESKRKMNDSTKRIMDSMKRYSLLFGKVSVYTLCIIYLILWIIFKLIPDSPVGYIEVIYFTACIIFGPSSTIFPLLYVYFVKHNLMTDAQFWMGVPFAFIMPGTSGNIAIYYATVIDGWRGAILSWIFLYTPTFLTIYGILPDWSALRDRAGISRLLVGLNCVSLGFLLASIMMMLQHTINRDPGISIGIFIISLFQHGMIHVAPPILILVGAFLANTRRWGLLYYRYMEPPQY